MTTDPQHPVPASGGGTVDRESARERRRQPPLERIGTEVALDHEPPVGPLREARDPVLQHAVEFVLSHPDGRVRADRAERDPVGNILGTNGVDIGEAEALRVLPHEVESPLVDVDGPDRRVRGVQGEAQRDRTPAASQVEEVPTGGRGRRVGQENRGSGIQTVRTEDAARGHDFELTPGEGDTEAAELFGTRRRRAEIVVAPHAKEA